MKKRFMKRALSLFLATAMVFGTVQSPLFTQEAEAATADPEIASDSITVMDGENAQPTPSAEPDADSVTMDNVADIIPEDDNTNDGVMLADTEAVVASVTIGPKPADGTTVGQPFVSSLEATDNYGTGGSANFRIPGFVTLDDGTLVATADARWDTEHDGGGMDVVVSTSKDNGENWHYTYAGYMGDNGNVHNVDSATLMDPAVITDGTTLYLLADMYPAGYSTGGGGESGSTRYDFSTYGTSETGFDLQGRLLLSDNDRSSYDYYLENGTIYNVSTGTAVEGYTVKGWYDLYNADGEMVSNLFFGDSPYEVMNTSFIVMSTSTDGVNWSDPTLLNLKDQGKKFLILGPGRGLVTSKGRIIFSAYDLSAAYVVYSDDKGQTWNKVATSAATNENQIVELNDGTLRMFVKSSGTNRICYVDFTPNADGGYTPGSLVNTGVTNFSNCMVSAYKYPKLIDGKEAILVCSPSVHNASNTTWGGRFNGKIHVFTLDNDNNMTDAYEYQVNEDFFAYSCMTELSDGRLGLLYEDECISYAAGNYTGEKSHITYTTLDMNTIAPNSEITSLWLEDGDNNIVGDSITLQPGTASVFYVKGVKSGTLAEPTSSAENVVTVSLDSATDALTITAADGVTGLERQVVTVTDGTETITLNVTVASSDKYKDVTLQVGETQTFIDETGNYGSAELTGLDTDIANVTVTDLSGDNEQQVQLATALTTFDGSYVNLSDCLYTFTSTGTEDQYYVSAKTAAGAAVYLRLDGTSTEPNKSVWSPITVKDGETSNPDMVKLYCNTAVRYLHFHTETDKLYFNRCSSSCGVNDDFELYVRTEAATEDSPFAGYEKVSGKSQIISGGQYLITRKTDDGSYYLLYPAAAGSANYLHVAKATDRTANMEIAVRPASAITNNVTVFEGDLTGISNNLYTFEYVETSGNNKRYYISAVNSEGEKVYFNLQSSHNTGGRRPHQSTESSIEIVPVTDPTGVFNLYDPLGAGGKGSYLHFYNTDKLHFDRCGGNGCGAPHQFELYERSENADSSIPGYRKITSADEITDGNEYLIAFKVSDTDIYLLNPPAGTDYTSEGMEWKHVAKVTSEEIAAEAEPQTEIVIEGVKAGETSVKIGDTTYYINVEVATVNVNLEVGQEYRADGAVTQGSATEGVVSTVFDDSGYEKITSFSDFAAGKYLIGGTTFIMKNAIKANTTPTSFDTQVITESELQTADYSEYLWTFTASGIGYTIQDAQGNYINITASGSSGNMALTGTPQMFAVSDAGNGYVYISNGSYYFNDHAGNGDNVAGWNAADAGSKMYLYKPSEGRTVITGEKVGTTTMTIGGTIYNINVVGRLDYTLLDQQIQVAEGLKDDDSYTDESLAVLVEAYTKAKELSDSKNTGTFTSAEEWEAAQTEIDNAADALTAAIKGLRKKAMSIALTVGETRTFQVTGTLDEGSYSTADKEIAEVTVEDGVMTVVGLVPGIAYITLEEIVDGTVKNSYEYTILVAAEATAEHLITAKTGQSTDKIVTKLNISTDQTFDLDCEGVVSWSTPEILVQDADADGNLLVDDLGHPIYVPLVRVSEDGVISFEPDYAPDAVTLPYPTTVTAVMADGTRHTIPVIIYDEPTGTTKETTKIYDIYIDEISNMDVYYSWNCSTDLIQACVGEAFYVNFDIGDKVALDFLGAPDEGYALTYMSTTNSLSHYMTVHTGDDTTLDTSEDKGFLNYDGGAGVNQQIMFGTEQVMAMLYEGISRGADGVLGFTRNTKNTNVYNEEKEMYDEDTNSVVRFQSEKLPTIEKNVAGILPASGLREEYREYTPGMSTTEGEFVYFKVTVTTYRPLTFKEGTTQSMIGYSDVILTDDFLEGASFVEGAQEDESIALDQIIPNPAVTTKDITDAINAQVWADGQDTQVLEYYVAYKIAAEDLGTEIENTVDMKFTYQAAYSTGAYDVLSQADASISVAIYDDIDLIVDFGLPVTTTIKTWGQVESSLAADTDGNVVYDIIRLKTGPGAGQASYGTVDVEEVKSSDGSETTGWKITYTPEEVLQSADVVTLYADNVTVDGKPEEYTFKVYPASTVYYEETFLECRDTNNSGDATDEWTAQGTALVGEQEAAHAGKTAAGTAYNYGYDLVYETYAAEQASNSGQTYSDLSTAVTADGKEKAAFTFTGTGIDVFANCDEDTGIAMVMIRKLETAEDGSTTASLKKVITVDTKLNPGTVDAGLANYTETLNVPIVSLPEGSLEYGSYEVLIVHVPKKVTETTVTDIYSEKVPFIFPSVLNAAYELEAEKLERHNSGTDEEWPLQVTENAWASNGKFLNAMNEGDSAVLYYNAPVAGTYEATVRYRSGSSANGFSWSEASGKITSGSVTMGADDEARDTHTGTITLEVVTPGAGVLTFTAGSSKAPQLDKFDIVLTASDTVTADAKATPVSIATKLRLDGFRVYGTATTEERTLVHALDNEENPVYQEMRDSILAGMSAGSSHSGIYADQIAAQGMSQIYATSQQVALEGAMLLTTGTGDQLAYTGEDLTDFLDNSSKNELYIYPGQSLVFSLAASNENPQIGLKALNGAVNYTVTAVASEGTTETPTTLKDAEMNAVTEMYYPLEMAVVTTTSTADGTETTETTPVQTTFTITNDSTDNAVLSVTKLKVNGGAVTFGALTGRDVTNALVTLGFESNTTPEVTETPSPTGTPEATGTPEPTGAPEATETPEPTGTPEATGTPEPTGTPEATETPEPTGTPEATETPVPTGIPEETETPEPKKSVTEIFTDVYSDWYTDYVQYVYDNKLMTGIQGTTKFQPDANITKAQVAQVLYNMEGQPEVKDGSVFEKLSDVYEVEWYADAVAWAYGTGVVTGDLEEMKFFPNEDVTREQLALMMYRYAKYKEYDVTQTSDFAGLANADKTANWSEAGVRWAVGAGLITGVEENGVKDLAPQGTATRAQVAAILQRFCEAYHN